MRSELRLRFRLTVRAGQAKPNVQLEAEPVQKSGRHQGRHSTKLEGYHDRPEGARQRAELGRRSDHDPMRGRERVGQGEAQQDRVLAATGLSGRVLSVHQPEGLLVAVRTGQVQ